MIENIKREFVSYGNESTYRDDKKQIFDYLSILKYTINQLVDAVNELKENLKPILEERESGIKVYEEVMPNMKPADPYAEQRKWIGKLCRFWNKTEYTDDIYGFLTDIIPTNKYKAEDNYFVPFKDEFGSFYEHCEPVKPDDDIIYKGGDNEIL